MSTTPVEHEIQRQMLERLGIEWTPGEPFYALVEGEIRQLRETIGEWQEIHGVFTGDVHAACQAEIERLNTEFREQITEEHAAYQELRRAALESEALILYLRADKERLRAVIDAYLENDSQANWDALVAAAGPPGGPR